MSGIDIVCNADVRGGGRQFCQLQAEGVTLTVRLSLNVSKRQSLIPAGSDEIQSMHYHVMG